MKSSMIRRPRRGLASVAILIALIVIGLIGFGLLKVGLARRGEVGAEERRLQAGWLAEAGLDRAVARLAAADDFRGEVWEIPAEEFGGRGAASVTIRVEPVAGRDGVRKVRVEAEYPSGSSLRARKSREIIMEISLNSR